MLHCAFMHRRTHSNNCSIPLVYTVYAIYTWLLRDRVATGKLYNIAIDYEDNSYSNVYKGFFRRKKKKKKGKRKKREREKMKEWRRYNVKSDRSDNLPKNLMEAVSQHVFIRCKDFASLNNSLFSIHPFFRCIYSEPDLLVEMHVPFYELRYTVM